MKTKLLIAALASTLSLSAFADYSNTAKAFRVFDDITQRCEAVADAAYAQELPAANGNKKAVNDAFDNHMRAKFDCLDHAAFQRDKLLMQPTVLGLLKKLKTQDAKTAEKTLAAYGSTHAYRSVLLKDGQVVAKHDFGMTELAKVYNEPIGEGARFVPVVMGADSAIGYEEFTVKDGALELRVYVPMDTFGTRGGRLSPLDRVQATIDRVNSLKFD